MGVANEIWESFIKANPQVKSGKLSMDEINTLMAKHMKQINASPLDDFDGISPEQMHILLHDPFGTASPLEWIAPQHEEQAASVPLLVLSDLLIAEIQKSGELKLTQKGNLPIAVCTRFVERNLISSPHLKYIKKLNEDNLTFIWVIKDHLLVTGLAKKRNNKLSLTKNGKLYTEMPNSERLHSLFSFMTNRFNWQNLYGLEDDGQNGQLGWAFSLFLFLKHGNQPRNALFYAEKWMKALQTGWWKERNNPAYDRDIQLIEHAYMIRFFESFAQWFGLAHVEEKRKPKNYTTVLEVTRTELLEKLIRLK